MYSLLATLTTLTPTDLLFGALVQLLTLPYHRFFTYNTLRPIQEVQKHANQGVSPRSPHRVQLYEILVAWRSRKKDELNFAALGATVITAIVTASFSWGNVAGSVWVGPAFWYACLSTSICGIFLSAQQLSLLSLMGELPPPEDEVSRTISRKTIERHLGQILILREARGRGGNKRSRGVGGDDSEARGGGIVDGSGKVWALSWRLVFTWQCPMMFIAYSAFFYIVGLSVVVLTPLIREPWGENCYIAVAYAVSTALAWGLFAFCSLGGYGKISLHQREDEEIEGETDEGVMEPYRRTDTANTGVDTIAAAPESMAAEEGKESLGG